MMAKTMPARLLVVDQDVRYGEWLKHHLGVPCPESTVSALNLSDFERWSEELSGRDCDVLLLAAPFGSSPEDPQAQGLELLRQLREKPHFPAVIAVAEDGNELTAVRALQLGAVDYLPKRLLTPERLKTSVRLALRMIEKRVARRIANLARESSGHKSAVERDRAAEADRATAERRAMDVEGPADANRAASTSDRTDAKVAADAKGFEQGQGVPNEEDRANAKGPPNGEDRADAKARPDGGPKK